jgi:hypothetical protein
LSQRPVGLFAAAIAPYACREAKPGAPANMSAEETIRPTRRPGKVRPTGRRVWEPLRSLSAILRLDGDTAALREAMQQGGLDWAATAELASQHLLLPALWPALVDKKLVAPMPEALRRYLGERAKPAGEGRNFLLALEDMYLVNASRNASIRQQALEAIAALNAAGIEPGALKGTRHLLGGDSPFSRARILRDIDLVVVPGDWERAGSALRDAGYRATGAAPHAVSYGAPGAIVEIDLHRRPLSLHAPASLPAYLTEDGFWPPTIAIGLAGLRCRQLPPGESLVHSILHTEVADLNFAAGDWPLRYLHETAVVTRDDRLRPDWSVVEGLAGDDLRLPLQAHLYAAHRLFGGALPDRFAESGRIRRHFRRCRANALHPRSIRRASILVHKMRQAMSPWYLERKGYLSAQAGPLALWPARARVLTDLLMRYGWRLPRLLFGGDGDSVPPPRV